MIRTADDPHSVDPSDAAELLRRVLAAVAAGELTAPSGMTARLEGALDALDALSSAREDRA